MIDAIFALFGYVPNHPKVDDEVEQKDRSWSVTLRNGVVTTVVSAEFEADVDGVMFYDFAGQGVAYYPSDMIESIIKSNA